MQPLLFQDDIARLCTNRDDAQAGNMRIHNCLETKLLDANTDKITRGIVIITGDS